MTDYLLFIWYTLHSPTLDDAWVKDVLSKTVCEKGVCDENLIRDKVDRILIFHTDTVVLL